MRVYITTTLATYKLVKKIKKKYGNGYILTLSLNLEKTSLTLSK